MNAFGRKSRRMSLAAMFTAFTLVFLYLACVLPAGRLAMYFLSSVFIAGLAVENEMGLAGLLFVAVSAIGLLIMPDKLRLIPYVLFFGHYGIGKHYIEKLKDKFVSYVLKLLYFNAALVGMYFLAQSVLIADLPMDTWPIWALIAAAQVAFALYDYLYSKVTQYYFNRIRKWLVKPRG